METNLADKKLPLPLYRSDQSRALDRRVIEELEISGFTLMRRAGQAVFQVLLGQYPEPEKLTVFCGPGNNGGDGYVVATLARQHGIDVEIIQVGQLNTEKKDAVQARQLALQDNIVVTEFNPTVRVKSGIIVDAILGTGLRGAIQGVSLSALECINEAGLPVIAADIPTGICSDTGRVWNKAVYAQHTVSFICVKQGLLTGAAPDYTGVVHFANLGLPESVFAWVDPSSYRLDFGVLRESLSARQRSAHKGLFGHVMVTGGDSGMAGAAAMASQAATRVGAGLVSCATRPEHIAAVIGRCPEIMVHGVISGQEVEPLLQRASVVVVGPGLGRGSWGEQLLQQVCKLDVPLVVDADALNLLADGRVIKKTYRENWILTPHPGEAARLLNCSTADVQADRFAAVLELQGRYGGAVVLKGAGTLIADADNDIPGLSCYGNPGMASGGMGDVLSGVLGGLLAQGLSVSQASRLGVCLHGKAADLAAKDGERGLLATDLIPHFRALLK